MKPEDMANEAISHLKKSPVLKAVFSAADTIMDVVNATHRMDPMSLDMLVTRFSKDTDRLILDSEQVESLNFIGGHLAVSPDGVEDFKLNLNLYFKSRDGKVVLKDVSRSLPLSILEESSISEIKQRGELKYEVNYPGN